MAKIHTSVENDIKEEVVNSVVEEIDYDLVASGPLYLDPRHKKPGFVYQWVGDVPGEINTKQRLGWVVVQDEINVGDNKPSNSSRFGSAVTVQSKCGMLLVLMAITEQNFSKYEAYKEKKNKEITATLGKIQDVPEEYQTFNGQPLGELKITKRS